ncbi:MAG: acyl-CoA dehydrogenase family protein [Proteobacteria bacterium]|nr:acyl-CoA dehydrogenase family protein [Pseudomonadota bacterium]
MEETGAWELPSELVLLRDNVRRFMRDEVCPAEETLPHDAYKMPDALLAPLQKKAKEQLGLWCVNTPAIYGGSELGLFAQAIVAEEAAQCRMGAYVPACAAIGIDPPNVIFDGTEEQIRDYGKRTIDKGLKAFVAISEPSGGADPARAIQCKAERHGDTYILNGTKLWITAAEAAEWGIVFARTDAGITCFIVDKGMEGMATRPIPVIRSYSPSEVTFTDCKVPANNLLGEEGKGFALCQKWLVHARIPYSANVIGIAQRSLELAIEWAKQRETFRSKLADKQAVQWMIADSEVEIRAARLLTWQAAWQGDLGHDIKIAASMAKLYSTEMAGRVVDRCIQIFGAMGVAAEMPLERWYRELRIKRIGEGPSEVHRMVIARDLLRG